MSLTTSSTPTTIPGTYVYTPPAGTVPAVGTVPLSVVFTPTDPNYQQATKTVNLIVNKAQLTVTANNETTVYGTTRPPYTYTITGFVNGDTQATATTGAPSLSTSPATPTLPGTYAITTALGTLASTNYSLTLVNGTLTITGRPTLTVTAASANRSYGAVNPTFSASATGAVNGDTFTFTESTAATTASPVGTYPIAPLATGANLGNYTVVYVNGTLTIGQATLTVTAGNASRLYGATNPTFTATVTGAQGTDSFTTTESTTATTFSPAGTYPIFPLATGVNLANYTVVYVNGTLTVGQATLTVTAANASRAYGAANPTFTASAAGAQNSDTFTSPNPPPPPPASPVGTYPIVPLATGANLANYTVVYVNGTLTVNKATLTVTAANASRAYGAALTPPSPPPSPEPQNGDTQATAFTGLTEAPPPPPPPRSTPEPTRSTLRTGTSLANYTVVYVPGTLTVGQATLTVTAANASRAYGAANPSFTASATGAVSGDTFTFTESTTATTASPVGTYPIVPLAAGASLANYNVVYVNGTLTVGKAVLTVTASNQNITYGAALPTYTATLTGFLNGDTQATAVTGSAALSTTPATPVNARRNLPHQRCHRNSRLRQLQLQLRSRNPHHRAGHPHRHRSQRLPRLRSRQPHLLRHRHRCPPR